MTIMTPQFSIAPLARSSVTFLRLVTSVSLSLSPLARFPPSLDVRVHTFVKHSRELVTMAVSLLFLPRAFALKSEYRALTMCLLRDG